ncbi:MAG TPA: phosphate ABC transporter substrate-binding protein PstS [Solirubrobacteraceae bacterium]
MTAVVAAVGIAACGGSSSSTASSASGGSSTPTSSTGGGGQTINGAGSTLAAPLYNQWAANLSTQGLTVNYQGNGSGAGIAELQGATADFAGSDPPEKPSEIAAGKGPVAMFPIAFGAITVSYNVPGLKTGLKLDGKTIADIFLGKVKKWDDPEIKALNPGLSLPGPAITVVHRSDSSGTTKGFTTFLSDYSPAWTAAAGKPDKVVNWPTGTGAKGNAGVAAVIKQTPGAVGYIDQAYAIQNGFTYAAVKNSAGKFVRATLDTASAAAVGIPVPANLAISSINSPSPTAYPIVSQTFLIVYKDMCKVGIPQSRAKAVKQFIAYGLSTAGQAVEKQLFYAPLPPPILSKDQAQLTSLTCNGTPLP